MTVAVQGDLGTSPRPGLASEASGDRICPVASMESSGAAIEGSMESSGAAIEGAGAATGSGCDSMSHSQRNDNGRTGEAQAQLHAKLVELTAHHHTVIAYHLEVWRREQEDLLSQLCAEATRIFGGSLCRQEPCLTPGHPGASLLQHAVPDGGQADRDSSGPPPEVDAPPASKEPAQLLEIKPLITAEDRVEETPNAHKKTSHKKGMHKKGITASSDPELTQLQQFVTAIKYELCSCCLIILNALFLGFQAEVNANAARDLAMGGQEPRVADDSRFLPIQIPFCVLFCLDLGLRWAADGLFEFFQSDFYWNVFDVVIVGMNIMDIFLEVIYLILGESSPEILANTSVLRVLRLIRIVRVARVIRVLKFFRELRMMVFSIISSMTSLLWVIVVLGVVWYVFAIIFTVGTISYLETADMWQASENEELVLYFTSIFSSILHLYMAMSGGNDWGQYFDALSRVSPGLASLLLFYILFVVFAVCNIVTAVFVDAAMQANHNDQEVVVQEALEEQRAIQHQLQEIFMEIDADDTGIISMEELEEKMTTERVVAYFRALGLDTTDAKSLFSLLDTNNSNAVEMDEFLNGCFKLLGEAKTLDMKLMMREVRSISDRLRIIRTQQVAHHGDSSGPRQPSWFI